MLVTVAFGTKIVYSFHVEMRSLTYNLRLRRTSPRPSRSVSLVLQNNAVAKMLKVFIALASLVSAASVVIAAPIPQGTGLLDSLLGSGGGSTNGPNGGSGTSDPLSSILGESAAESSSSGPNGSGGGSDPLSEVFGVVGLP
ncbi:hypothetical protein SCHPADRAFT_944526 [Schizopora paradoxa]|uniref:Uncharacterized protein n=1 Tax=Schizopora paradoxa TaxID=27342 RepID=A0A0H2R904_9AGAM|nr:hypothetical protein SCHPADRAFT_944526 [Schizopora paradoxa]